MQRTVRLLLLALIAPLLSPLATNMGIAVADANPTTITICTSLKTGSTLISKTGKCNPRIYEARTWHKLGTAPLGTPGSAPIDLVTCQSKGSTTQIIRSRTACNRTTQNTARWQRPVGPAIAPSISSVVMGLQGTATLKIEPPVNDGGSRITSYIVTTNPGGVTTTFTPAQIKTAQITGLKPGTTYSFSTVAVNAKSPSPLSTETIPALALTTAGMPTITSVVATGTNTAQLTFTAPADNGGSPITSYVVTAMPGGLRTTISQAGGGTINISNLSPSTNYTFTITANNAAGASSAAPAPLAITTATPPPPPAPVAVAPSAPANTVISVASIAGVTAPFSGATPVTTTTAGTGYTGTVTWSGSPSTFASVTTYTATISLTVAAGYTLTGVTANFFTVAGATTVTHSANSGVITAVFPATALAAPAFTLSAASETRSVNTTATGFTVNSTGGAATFAISPSAPSGMSFNTTTGAFSGTPTSVAAPIAYTVTASNATGPNATQTFTLTVVGASNKVAITRASVGTERRTAFTTQPQITVQDSAGNTITSSSDVVTASVSAGGTLVGTITATAASGIATFTGLGVDGTIGTTYTITYTVAGLAVATVTVALTGTSCDGNTFTCQVGDTGPSGGTIFYAAVSTFTCGPALTSNCTYLEAAPTTGTGAWIDASYLWSGINNFEIGANAQGTAIGTGYKNTEAMVAQTQGGVEGATGSTPNRAGTISLAYSRTFLSVIYDDWFLPSKDELNQLRLQRVVVGINSGNTYWSSTEASNINAHGHRFSDNANGATNKSQSSFVRPIRAF